MQSLSSIPDTINFSDFGRTLDIDEPMEFGIEDKMMEKSFHEDYFLFILKTLPKDRYRVVALMLLIRTELGYDFTYKDIASIWGIDNTNIVKIMKRIQKVFTAKKMQPKTMATDKDKARVNFLSSLGYNQEA